MCLPVAAQNRRSRTLFIIGAFCLALALASRSMNLTFGLSPSPRDFVQGLLMGISIAINLHAVWLAGKMRRNRAI